MQYKGLFLNIVWLFFTSTYAQNRPREPWVFRCVLDETPRALVVALHQNLWLAYNTKNCQLQKIWSGNIQFRGEVYTSEKIIQPKVDGQYFLNIYTDTASAFYSIKNEQTHFLKAEFYSYQVLNNKVAIKYSFKIDSATVWVTEYPEYKASNKKGMIVFERKFIVKSAYPTAFYIALPAVHMPAYRAWAINAIPTIIEKRQILRNNQYLYFETLTVKISGNDSLVFRQNIKL